MAPVWLKRPISDSNVPFEHLEFLMALFMSVIQSLDFSGVRKTLKRRESISQPSTTFLSSNFPSAACFVKLMMGLRGSASFLLIGRKME